MSERTITVEMFDDEGELEEVHLPASWVICDTCKGEGTALRRSLRGHVYTQSDFEEDPSLHEFIRDMRDGAYDDQCDECRGKGKVLEVDFDRMSPELQARYEAHCKEEHEYEATRRAELAFERGCAGDIEGMNLARRGYL